jgi:hypothetical protein
VWTSKRFACSGPDDTALAMSCGEAEGYRRAGVARFVGGTPAQITLSGLTEAVSSSRLREPPHRPERAGEMRYWDAGDREGGRRRESPRTTGVHQGVETPSSHDALEEVTCEHSVPRSDSGVCGDPSRR